MKPWGSFPGLAVLRFLDDGKQAELLAPFVYVRSDGVAVTAPVGFVTDGASIPAVLWPFVDSPFTGNNLRPAIIHDYLCRLGRVGLSPWDSKEVHYMLHQGLRLEGDSAWRARLKWVAVRAVGVRFQKAGGG